MEKDKWWGSRDATTAALPSSRDSAQPGTRHLRSHLLPSQGSSAAHLFKSVLDCTAAMFSRFINAIDQQIAQEQSRSYQSSRSPAGNKEGGSAVRSSSRLRPETRGSSSKTGTTTPAGSTEKDRDPSEFEADLDTSAPTSSLGTPTRGSTPVQPEAVTDDPLGAVKDKEKDEANKGKDEKAEGDGKLAAPNASSDKSTGNVGGRGRTASLSTAAWAADPKLPAEVRQKLRKLDKIEGRYNGKQPLLLTSTISMSNWLGNRFTAHIQDRIRT